jgi:hypothetical protein
MVHPLALLLTLALSTPAAHPPGAVDSERDSDRDGLSDFHELHKYRTDPRSKDSDGDGIPDGDWDERREFTYSVRAVMQVLPPINVAALNDDYQDGRILQSRRRAGVRMRGHLRGANRRRRKPEQTAEQRGSDHGEQASIV